MAYLSGSQALSAGIQDVDVVFSPAFETAPSIIIPVVNNSSADSVKYLLHAEEVAKSANGFSVRLSAPTNTAHYTLEWVAGDPTTMYQLTLATGVKVSDLPVTASLPDNADRIPFTRMAPTPTTETIEWQLLRAAFPTLAMSAPGSSVATGVVNQIFIEGDYLYTFGDDNKWGRTARSTSWP